MPYIEQEKLQELIEDVNILDVVDYLGIECHKRGSNYFMLCPSPKHNDTHATKTVANVSVAKRVDILRHQ